MSLHFYLHALHIPKTYPRAYSQIPAPSAPSRSPVSPYNQGDRKGGIMWTRGGQWKGQSGGWCKRAEARAYAPQEKQGEFPNHSPLYCGVSPLHLPGRSHTPLPHMKKRGPMAGDHGSGHPDRGIFFNGVRGAPSRGTQPHNQPVARVGVSKSLV